VREDEIFKSRVSGECVKFLFMRDKRQMGVMRLREPGNVDEMRVSSPNFQNFQNFQMTYYDIAFGT